MVRVYTLLQSTTGIHLKSFKYSIFNHAPCFLLWVVLLGLIKFQGSFGLSEQPDQLWSILWISSHLRQEVLYHGQHGWYHGRQHWSTLISMITRNHTCIFSVELKNVKIQGVWLAMSWSRVLGKRFPIHKCPQTNMLRAAAIHSDRCSTWVQQA